VNQHDAASQLIPFLFRLVHAMHNAGGHSVGLFFLVEAANNL
jgi:hypothetical protein